ncbi:MAG: InlB B-repeat-containing protein, partial [Bacteroidia bacterium]
MGQATIFTETVGTCCSTTNTSISGTTFDNGGLTFSGTADTRTSTASSGYSGASGGRNVFFTNTVGREFVISGINTSGYTSLILSFGHYKSTTASNNELAVEISSDGSNWTSLSYSRATGMGTANWALITPTGTIPATANLRIRFRQTSATPQFRIDDVKLMGTAAPTNYTVTFNGNGATGGTMANQTASSATNLTANAFTRTGYTFAGWNTAANGSGTAYANSSSFPFTANTTLFAQWTANTLTVTYDSQGGSAVSSGTTITGGQIISAPGTPTRVGFTFNGWFVASSGGTAISFPYTHGQTANFTLYAQWTASGGPILDGTTLVGSLSGIYGSATAGISFTASGSSLTGNITATAQPGFEVSTTSGSGYGASVSVASGTSVWIRIAASQNAGSYNNTVAVVLSSSGASSANVLTSAAGNLVSPKPLSITAPTIASKPYDATTTSGAVTVGTLSGFVGSQTVTATATAANYSSANVGTYTNVTVNYTLSNGTNGGLAINYSLAAGSATGAITQRALTITANNVTKDAGTVISGGSGSTAFTSSGLQGGETIGSVTIAYGAAAGSIGQGATPGTYSAQVTPSAATGGTFNSANYSITYVAGSIIVVNYSMTPAAGDIAFTCFQSDA